MKLLNKMLTVAIVSVLCIPFMHTILVQENSHGKQQYSWKDKHQRLRLDWHGLKRNTPQLWRQRFGSKTDFHNLMFGILEKREKRRKLGRRDIEIFMTRTGMAHLKGKSVMFMCIQPFMITGNCHCVQKIPYVVIVRSWSLKQDYMNCAFFNKTKSSSINPLTRLNNSPSLKHYSADVSIVPAIIQIMTCGRY